MKKRKLKPVYARWLMLIITAIPFVWTIMLIDNWKRDFSENYATTSVDAGDPLLKPAIRKENPAVVAEQIQAWAAGKSRWSIETMETDPAGIVRLHLVRRTLIFRFKDDIHVAIYPVGNHAALRFAPPGTELPVGGSVTTAESQSRLGKGDLGQNPRNLRELISAIQ